LFPLASLFSLRFRHFQSNQPYRPIPPGFFPPLPRPEENLLQAV
jgi:hypothetical protein